MRIRFIYKNRHLTMMRGSSALHVFVTMVIGIYQGAKTLRVSISCVVATVGCGVQKLQVCGFGASFSRILGIAVGCECLLFLLCTKATANSMIMAANTSNKIDRMIIAGITTDNDIMSSCLSSTIYSSVLTSCGGEVMVTIVAIATAMKCCINLM